MSYKHFDYLRREHARLEAEIDLASCAFRPDEVATAAQEAEARGEGPDRGLVARLGVSEVA